MYLTQGHKTQVAEPWFIVRQLFYISIIKHYGCYTTQTMISGGNVSLSISEPYCKTQVCDSGGEVPVASKDMKIPMLLGRYKLQKSLVMEI